MADGIDAIRELRASDSFEATMSHFVHAIGKIERLGRLDAEQRQRVEQQIVRLHNALRAA